jgi:hypothetical protein
MAIKLAANLIPFIPQNYGHLQLINTTTNIEIEVQSGKLTFLGSWAYSENKQNPENTPNYNVAGKYASVELNLGDRSESNVWQLMSEIHAQFQHEGLGIDYDFDQNSNSYINTLMYMTGFNLNTVIGDATPTEVTDGFPGDSTNVITNDNLYVYKIVA